jgi:hypothetical protein
MAALTSDEINFLIYRYLRESGQAAKGGLKTRTRALSRCALHSWLRFGARFLVPMFNDFFAVRMLVWRAPLYM